MKHAHMLKLTILGVIVSAAALALLLLFYFLRLRRASSIRVGGRRSRTRTRGQPNDLEKSSQDPEDRATEDSEEDLITFQGGEDLAIDEILDAPGEVIGKSSYGTLYRALFQRDGSVKLLRFMRPICVARGDEFFRVVESLGTVRHPNLVPLLGFYAGSRGEKLLVYPFYRKWNLAEFVREWADGSGDSLMWATIYKISMGIARGLDHLHTGLTKPTVHGNLKSKNIFLDRHHEPYISDFGLHLLLNPTAGQEMLEASAVEGYKAPELIKIKEASVYSDMYSLGVILLEMLTGREPINGKASPDEECHLPNYIKQAVLRHRLSELYHPGIVLGDRRGDDFSVMEDRVLKLFQLALACCSPSPSLRPNTKQVLLALEEIGK